MRIDTRQDREARRQAQRELGDEMRRRSRESKARHEAARRVNRWWSWQDVRSPSVAVEARWPVSGPKVLDAIDRAGVAQQVEALDRLSEVLDRRGRWLPGWAHVFSAAVGAAVGVLWAFTFGFMDAVRDASGLAKVDAWVPVVGVVGTGALVFFLLGLLLEAALWRWGGMEDSWLQWVMDAATDPDLELSEQEQELIREDRALRRTGGRGSGWRTL